MMGKLTGLCVLLLVLNVAVTEDTVTTVYFADGGDLTLEVRPPLPDHINIISWIFNGYLLAEWVEDESYYLRIKGRANLTTETGQLIINKMSKEDEGVYSVEINDRVQSERYQAKLIKKVQKPKVLDRTLNCIAIDHSCKFSCDSNTTEAEPITYSWKKGDGEWKVSGKDITITREHDSGGKTFTCRMENPVSREESDPLYKKLFTYNTAVAISVLIAAGAVALALVVVVVLSVVLVGLIEACEKKIFLFKNRRTNITDPAHGNGQPTSHPSDSSPNPAEIVPLQANPQDTKSDAKETA
ncbi:SLAM family member 9-like [Sebastes umbrosus]|uniref:SLAM family member 9-like n=1 Tax=Sebastes umbrosus TaxID=72105 RepID=UPI00189EC544|nr:SLAM family member 9-like [Sebastes umbrosus]